MTQMPALLAVEELGATQPVRLYHAWRNKDWPMLTWPQDLNCLAPPPTGSVWPLSSKVWHTCCFLFSKKLRCHYVGYYEKLNHSVFIFNKPSGSQVSYKQEPAHWTCLFRLPPSFPFTPQEPSMALRQPQQWLISVRLHPPRRPVNHPAPKP